MKRKLAIAFFFSGAAALMYQVLWARMLGLVFGNTTYAVSTVLAAFMGGMALGSWFLGRRADRSGFRPVRALAFMEAGIGLLCAVSPLLFSGAAKVYVLAQQGEMSLPAVTLLRFLLSSVILLAPTFLMGGTLPVMTRALKALLPEAGVPGAIGLFYGLNTAGAVFGVLFSAFVSIAYFGVGATLAIAVCANLAVAATFYRLSSGEREPSAASAGTPAAPADPGLARLTLAAAAVSGFASMVCEVAWTRALSLVIGMSVYAFAIMLAAFLAGIAGGSLIFTRFAEKRVKADGKEGFLAVGVMLGAAGVLILTTVPVFDHLPLLFLRLFAALGGSFAGHLLLQTLVAFVIMAVPAALFGLMFPMLIKIYSLSWVSPASVPSAVGRIYASNTAGCIAGSLATGFALISRLGLAGSIRSAGFLCVASALAVLLSARDLRRLAFPIAGFLVFAAAPHLLAMGAWEPGVMNSGVYQYAPDIIENARSQGIGIGESFRQIMENKEQLYQKDGAGFSVAVARDRFSGVVSLAIDGKVDASSDRAGDMNTQLLSGHLPLLLHKAPKKVLVIGLASGITLGAVARHPVEEIDCVEIEPSMIKAAGYFDRWNRGVLRDKRVRIIKDDARNYLLLNRKKYDVIISEPSNPWIQAASPLFTKEYFALVRKSLAPDGVFCQWMQLYDIRIEGLKTVMNSVKSAFPDLSLWNPYAGDTLIIATPGRLSVDQAAFESGFSYAREDASFLGIRSPYGLLARFVMASPELDGFIKDAGTNSDDSPVIEFSAPRSMLVKKYGSENYRTLQNGAQAVSPYLKPAGGGKLELALAEEYLAVGAPAGAEKELRLLTARKPAADSYELLGRVLERLDRPEEARTSFEKAAAMDPSSPGSYVALSRLYSAANDAGKAMLYAKKALSAKRSARTLNQLGLVLLKAGDARGAARSFSSAYNMEKDFIQAYLNEARVYIDILNIPPAALEVLGKAARANPNDPDVLYQLGRALYRMGMAENARDSFNAAIALNPGYRAKIHDFLTAADN